jgi:hypothetical protein
VDTCDGFQTPGVSDRKKSTSIIHARVQQEAVELCGLERALDQFGGDRVGFSAAPPGRKNGPGARAGGGSVAHQSNKMANTVESNARLRKAYNPVNVPSVRRFDEARAIGAKKLEQKPDESVGEPVLLTLFANSKK